MSLHNPSIGDFKAVRERWLDLGGDQWIQPKPDPSWEKFRKLYDEYVKGLDEAKST